MAEKDRNRPYGPLSQSEFTAETKRLLADLAFYARGPVRIQLKGGQAIAYTYNTEDKLHTINIVMNPSILANVRTRERAIAIWRGIGFHELAHHLWPAEAQYKISIEEGFKSLFNLVDDEQNERRGRAQDPNWGACFQTVCAYIFPTRDRKTDRLSTGIIDGGEEDDDPKDGIEASEIYRLRWNQFAYHFRRHMPGADDKAVIDALALIPKRFKDLTKEELLDLTRQIHLTLSRGLELPEPAQAQGGKREPGDAAEDDPDALPLPRGTRWWKGLFKSKWSYITLAVFVLTWGAFLSQGGLDFWAEVFWILAGVAGIFIGFVLVRAVLRRLFKRKKKEDILDIRKEGLLKRLLRKAGQSAEGKFDWLFAIFALIGRWPVWRAIARGWRRFKKWWKRTRKKIDAWWRYIWSKRLVRIAVLALPIALWAVMLWAVMARTAAFSWWALALFLLWLLVMAVLFWLFRKKIIDFLIGELLTDEEFEYAINCQPPVDKETMEFNMLTNVKPVDADPEFLSDVLPLVYPLGQALRPALARIGVTMVDKDDQHAGFDLVDELEQTALGETAIFVDEEMVRQTSIHIEVAVDCSSSMVQANETLKKDEKFRLAKLFALAVEEAVRNQPGMSAHMWGFTDYAIYDCGEAGAFRVSGLKAAGGNNDSAMLWHMGQSALKSGKTVKLLLMISDGQPSDCSWGSLNNLKHKFESEGMIPWNFLLEEVGDPAFEGNTTILRGQAMAEAIVTMGETLAAIADAEF